MKKSLKKLFESGVNMSTAHVVTTVFQEALDEYREGLYGAYDESDPTMNDVGMEEWNNQVDSAVDELHTRLVDLVEEIEEGLYSGAFYED